MTIPDGRHALWKPAWVLSFCGHRGGAFPLITHDSGTFVVAALDLVNPSGAVFGVHGACYAGTSPGPDSNCLRSACGSTPRVELTRLTPFFRLGRWPNRWSSTIHSLASCIVASWLRDFVVLGMVAH